MRLCGLVLLAASGLLGCGDPAGVVRVHFALSPPTAVDFGGLTPPPVDPLALSRAQGSIEATPPTNHLVGSFAGLPPAPGDPYLVYRFWLSPSSTGGSWAHAADVNPNASGAGFAHVRQTDVALRIASIRSAMLTLDPPDATGPSTTIILAGAAAEQSADDHVDAGGGGGHMH